MQIQIPEAFDFLFEPMRYKVTWGGRGAAKSRSYATALIIKGIQEPCRILCTREFQSTIKESVKFLLDDRIQAMGLDTFYDSKRDIIEGSNGTQFIFAGLHNNIGNIKSLEKIKYCWCEEAQTLSKESIEVLIPTIRDNGSEIWFSFNTGSKLDAVYSEFITNNNRTDAIVKKVNFDSNPFFPEVLRKEMEYCKINNPDKYNHIWLGDPLIISDAVIFKDRYKIERFEPPKDTVFYHAIDWGFTDPMAVTRCYIDEEANRLYIDRCKMSSNITIDDIDSFLTSYIPDIKQWMITADNARPELINFLKLRNYRIRACKKGKDSIVEGIDFMKNYQIIIHEDLKDLIYEFSNYSYKVDKRSGEIIPQIEDKNNHGIDSIRYSLELVRNPIYETTIF